MSSVYYAVERLFEINLGDSTIKFSPCTIGFISIVSGDMVNESMVKSEIKYNIGYVFKDTTLKLNVNSRKYSRYSQYQYGDSVIEIDFEC